MSNTALAFENGKAFIAFVTVGDPDLETTEAAVCALANAGCDMIELGIPFSDPTAEGPVIREADSRALRNGITTERVLRFAEKIRRQISVPLAFMTYANVVFSYGIEAFVKRCAQIGVDGLLLPDVPYEESHEFRPICRKYGVDFISFIAPTSKQRIQTIAKDADGFIYVISSLGVTGERKSITTDIASITRAVREVTGTPCAVGFGISSAGAAKKMAAQADGVIVGSALVRMIAEDKANAAKNVGAFAREIKRAITEA